MGVIKSPQPVLPIAGLIYQKGFDIRPVIETLEALLGKTVLTSEVIEFNHTSYYNKEMGENLLRQWLSFGNLLQPDELAELKLRTNELERLYLNENQGRKINIDPGIISLNNLILASTKNYSHRIYIGKGIYAELTLLYQKGIFRPLEWTYPDYREEGTRKFFTRVREILKKRISEVENV